MFSKKHTAETVFYMITVVTVMVAAVVCCLNKQGMHEDEFYSYYSSNRTYGPVLEDTVSRDTVMDELTVRDGEGFNYGLVREVQSWDVHPPVYYFILHSVCSLMPGVFSMWQGLWINLACLLISLILMVRLGDKLLPAPSVMTVCLGILAWGISAATLTGVVFIRMYMLLTVWILAVTLLHLGKSDNKWFWPALGALTFCGFMTHYYFFIWLFFLAVAWNIREMIRTKSIRTTLYYGLTMIVSFGACYLFYPAFPAQMFRGQRGAQAAGNFFDIGNTWERIVFFAEKVNRIGFGGILWVLTGLVVIMYLMNADSRRGLRPRIARWSASDARDARYSPIRYDEADEAVSALMEGADETPVEGAKTGHSRRCGSDVMLLCCSLTGYFLVVSKTALMLGDSSIRYQMPVLGILYLCLTAGLVSGACQVARVLTRDGDKSERYGLIAAGTVLAVLIVMNAVSDLNGGISFLYPEKKEHMATLAAYPDADVIYVYPDGQSWIAWADMTELLEFEEVTYISSGLFISEYDADPHVPADEHNTDTLILFADKGTGVLQSGDMECLYSDVYCDIYVMQ
ncbi:MAG: hypothetical protein IKS16_07150 [Lachnospiraceae bacterium]|nr:hypothetical protein [Lachnospiraceae bacterium]